MTPEQHDILVEIRTKMNALISDDHATGLVPDIRQRVDDHDKQISFWRGGIAVVALLILALAGFLAEHVFSGR